MFTLEDYENLKSAGVTGFKEFYEPFMNMANDMTSVKAQFQKEIHVPYNESLDTYYNESPDVVVNLPSDSNVEFNFTPDLTTEGELTSSIAEEEDTVKSDPFDISPLIDEESQAYLDEETEEEDENVEDTTPRFMTLQDLM